MNFIDYSQYKLWSKCPWAWYERYVGGFEKRKSSSQRGDAMAIGSLTHAGLEVWAKTRTVNIPREVIDEIGPTPEALDLARQLLNEYIRKYPDEDFNIEKTETPMLFDIGLQDIHGMALIDNFFYNEKERQMESGISGEAFSIQPGWWIREYKTKAQSKPRGMYQLSWQTNMQADFQLLAMQSQMKEKIQGLFVCVLEKPKMYVPKRKCKGCAELLEFGTYLSTGDGHACPLCGTVQQLSPYVPKVERRPEVYRMIVSRSEEQLEISRLQIRLVAEQMRHMRECGDMNVISPTKENCVDFFGQCEFFDNHTYGKLTSEDQQMVKRDTTKYARLEELVQIQ